MSLIIEVNLNVTPLHRLVITRLEGGSEPDSINEYIATLISVETGTSMPYYVEHRYGDGALVLVQKVLALINRPKE